MENQREEEEEDRISQLPVPLLHQILCSGLSQKEAVQTCVLSKSWRHLGPTRPKIEFRERMFNGNHEMYLSVLEKTLQRYHEQNLSLQEIFIFEMKEGSKSSELLEKWIPKGVNKCHLYIGPPSNKSDPGSFRLPPVLLKAEFLKELCLRSCQIDPFVDEVLCKNLRKLSLNIVYITDETIEKIMSSCPLIEDLVMDSCHGLETTKLTKAPNLKSFKFKFHGWDYREAVRHSIEIDAPSIESISITNYPNWIHHPQKMYFPRLKSLSLYRVRLSDESIDKISTNLPCLENLSLCYFSDSEQLKLSSRSIKHLTIAVEGSSFKAAIIDAPNILSFALWCDILPSSISLTTTSTEWQSKVRVGSTLDFDNGASSWFHRLSEICKELSTSQITLHVCDIPQVVPDGICGDVCQPFVIENLSLQGMTYSSIPDFLNCFFRNFRPRNIVHQINLYDKRCENPLLELLCKILLSGSERAQYIGQQNLEDVKMEARNKNDKAWRGVEGTSSLSEFALHWNTLWIRFRLYWRIE